MTSPDVLKKTVPQIYSHTGLRGIAAMSVVVSHFSQDSTLCWTHYQNIYRFFHWHGEAVDLFFILSGFILNWVYCSNNEKINWSLYLRARVARIMPLYYLTTFLYIPFSLIHHGIAGYGADYLLTIFSNIFMVSGIMDGFKHTINGPAWSIGVEFFCYLAVFPLLVCLKGFLKLKRHGLLGSILLVGFLTFCVVHFYHIDPIKIGHFKWDSTWLTRGIFGFSEGFFICTIYQLSARWQPSHTTINVMFLVCVVIFLMTRLAYLPSYLLLYAFPLLVYCTIFDLGIGSTILRTKPLQWLGERSYSIYLWHMPILIFQVSLFSLIKKVMPTGPLDCLLLVILVLMISEFSYQFFESPCRRFIRNLKQDKFAIFQFKANEVC
jgi:peptidoglycan/LPS O-acetylase OafA/YrhL